MSTILADIDAFAERYGLSDSQIGRKALNDTKAIGQIRNGRRVWPETEQRIRDFMAAYAESFEEIERVKGASCA